MSAKIPFPYNSNTWYNRQNLGLDCRPQVYNLDSRPSLNVCIFSIEYIRNKNPAVQTMTFLV